MGESGADGIPKATSPSPFPSGTRPGSLPDRTATAHTHGEQSHPQGFPSKLLLTLAEASSRELPFPLPALTSALRDHRGPRPTLSIPSGPTLPPWTLASPHSQRTPKGRARDKSLSRDQLPHPPPDPQSWLGIHSKAALRGAQGPGRLSLHCRFA